MKKEMKTYLTIGAVAAAALAGYFFVLQPMMSQSTANSQPIDQNRKMMDSVSPSVVDDLKATFRVTNDLISTIAVPTQKENPKFLGAGKAKRYL